mmetsp:Transcript_8959/g.15294  ORF Transcript_8959/g.15294 Transcript_8959/m.15294 type:complete len:452 (-) Transcript_8959:291-1646(-)
MESWSFSWHRDRLTRRHCVGLCSGHSVRLLGGVKHRSFRGLYNGLGGRQRIGPQSGWEVWLLRGSDFWLRGGLGGGVQIDHRHCGVVHVRSHERIVRRVALLVHVDAAVEVGAIEVAHAPEGHWAGTGQRDIAIDISLACTPRSAVRAEAVDRHRGGELGGHVAGFIAEVPHAIVVVGRAVRGHHAVTDRFTDVHRSDEVIGERASRGEGPVDAEQLGDTVGGDYLQPFVVRVVLAGGAGGQVSRVVRTHLATCGHRRGSVDESFRAGGAGEHSEHVVSVRHVGDGSGGGGDGGGSRWRAGGADGGVDRASHRTGVVHVGFDVGEVGGVALLVHVDAAVGIGALEGSDTPELHRARAGKSLAPVNVALACAPGSVAVTEAGECCRGGKLGGHVSSIVAEMPHTVVEVVRPISSHNTVTDCFADVHSGDKVVGEGASGGESPINTKQFSRSI